MSRWKWSKYVSKSEAALGIFVEAVGLHRLKINSNKRTKKKHNFLSKSGPHSSKILPLWD